MSESASASAPDIEGLARDSGPAPAQRLSRLANTLRASDILRIVTEVRELQARGAAICDLTVGDFSPSQFPIPAKLRDAIIEAVSRGETNYPPPNGLLELRERVVESYARELGLRYPVESVVVGSGSRPGIYGAVRALCDPDDTVVFPVPGWNNHHYVQLVGAHGVPVACGPEDHFLPTRAALARELPGARLLCLCSPLNPAGTVFARETLRGICEDVAAENAGRERRGERPLYVLYDQVYRTLTFGGARHHTPPELLPELARYTVFVDGISKAYAATGLRVGWAVGPVDVIADMTTLIGHTGSWAPRPEQVATVALLSDTAAVAAFRSAFSAGIEARLRALCEGFVALQAAGLPVDSLEPMGAMYLTARLDLIGRRTPDGELLSTNEAIRRYVLAAAGVAIVPFQAFGTTEEDGWFRLSVGAVGLDEIEALLPRLRAALQVLR